jgi:predicted metal-binding membrane protein
MCRSMQGGMAMPGGWTMSMAWMPMPGQGTIAAAAMFLGMWLAMMVAMMLPSAAPMFLRGRRGAPAVGVAAGYFAVWLAAGAVVYPFGRAWASAAMASPALSRAAPALAGLMLVVAGALQLGRSKEAALSRCRAVSGCEASVGDRHEADHHPPSDSGFVIGVRQGLLCVRCCAGLMLALLALGTMSLAAMTGIAAVIALEKLAARPRFIVRTAGGTLLALGLFLLARTLA